MCVCENCKCNKKVEVDKEAMALNYNQDWVSSESDEYLEGTLEVAKGKFE